MTALREVIAAHGLPMALYTDGAHWAFHTPQAKGPVDTTQLTQVGRALDRLGIDHIPAYWTSMAPTFINLRTHATWKMRSPDGHPMERGSPSTPTATGTGRFT